MSDHERMSSPPELDAAADEDYGRLHRRNRRIRAVAWVVVISLIIAGGGSTVLLALFG